MTLIIVVLLTFVLLTLAAGALQRLAERNRLRAPVRRTAGHWPVYDPLDPLYRSKRA